MSSDDCNCDQALRLKAEVERFRDALARSGQALTEAHIEVAESESVRRRLQQELDAWVKQHRGLEEEIIQLMQERDEARALALAYFDLYTIKAGIEREHVAERFPEELRKIELWRSKLSTPSQS